MVNQTETEEQSIASNEPVRLPTLSVLRMLWMRRWFVLGFWSSVSIGSAIVIGSLPAVYRAEAVVLVNSQKIPESFVSPTVSGDVADRLALISQSIMTSARLLDIIDKFHLYKDERLHLTQEELLRKMRDDITVNFEKSWTGGRMQAFRLAYQGHDQEVVSAVTNRLARLYVEENVRARQDQADGTVNFLREQLHEAKRSLDEQEQKVAQFKQQYNGTLPEQQASLLGTLGSLSMQLDGIQIATARAQENKLSLEAALSAAESSEASLQRQSASSQLSADAGGVLKPRSEVLRAQLRQLLLRYSPQYPDVQALQQQIAEADRQESEDNNSVQAAPSDGPANHPAAKYRPTVFAPERLQVTERISNLRTQITVGNHQLDALEKERAKLSAAITDCQARIGKLPLVEQEMASLKRNYDESANSYNSLLQKQLAAGIATDMERSQKSERFTVIDAARIPERSIRPDRLLLDVLASAGALLVSVLIAFAFEFRKRTLLGEWELPVGSPVLGRVPLIQMTAAGREG